MSGRARGVHLLRTACMAPTHLSTATLCVEMVELQASLANYRQPRVPHSPRPKTLPACSPTNYLPSYPCCLVDIVSSAKDQTLRQHPSSHARFTHRNPGRLDPCQQSVVALER